MALPPFPAQMLRGGEVTVVRTARDYWNHYWAGWRPANAPVPVEEDDGFSDAAVAALIDNMSSQTFAALMRRVITKRELTLSQNPPGSPPPGMVWVDTSP